jgi:hypothetical protein
VTTILASKSEELTATRQSRMNKGLDEPLVITEHAA